MPFSASRSTKNAVTTSIAIVTVGAAAVAPASAPAAVGKPRIQSVQAAILVGGGLDPEPYVTVRTAPGTTSSVAVFWMGKRADLGADPSASTSTRASWTAGLSDIRKGQRVRLQITASGPGGTTTKTRVMRFVWRNVFNR